MRHLTLLFLVLSGIGCGNKTLVIVTNLIPGDGGTATQAHSAFEIALQLAGPATSFNPADLMRVLVDGVDRTDEVKLGGFFGVLRITPPPLGSHFVELSRREGPVIDTFTWTVNPHTGPTLASVTPTTARRSTQVTIAGTGFAAGALRVFFGGVEGTVDASSDTSITATVPADAVPGLVLVHVGTAAAEGIVGFMPTDDMDVPIPLPIFTLSAVFPASGGAGTVLRMYCYSADLDDSAVVNGTNIGTVIGLETITLPVIGDIITAFLLVQPNTPTGNGELTLDFGGNGVSKGLPFDVPEDD